jgi:hypothetical protein
VEFICPCCLVSLEYPFSSILYMWWYSSWFLLYSRIHTADVSLTVWFYSSLKLSVTVDGISDWWPDLVGFSIQRATALYSSLLHTHTHTNTRTHSLSLFLSL